jgi:hypothetical protein
MIDLKAIENELHQARSARMEAQAAGSEVEELIRSVQHFQPGKQRLFFFVDGLIDDLDDSLDDSIGDAAVPLNG